MEDIFEGILKDINLEFTIKSEFYPLQQLYLVQISDKKDQHTQVKVTLDELCGRSINDIMKDIVKLHKQTFEEE